MEIQNICQSHILFNRYSGVKNSKAVMPEVKGGNEDSILISEESRRKVIVEGEKKKMSLEAYRM